MKHKIILGCDHAGLELKSPIIDLLVKSGYQVEDKGCFDKTSVDYPDYAKLVCSEIVAKKFERGILICGSGIGMALTANKFAGIRAASLTDVYSTEMSRRHNNLNVLCLGARVVGIGLAEKILTTFLQTEFEGGRHQNRLDKITSLE